MAKIIPAKNVSKKEVIIEKAASLFRNKGYAAASMRELAESIGVEAPSLYNHIGSKSELLEVICLKVARSFTSNMDETIQQSISIKSKVESIIRFHLKMMLNDFNEVYVANHEWKHLKEPYLADFLEKRRAYEKRFVQLVADGIRAGEIKNSDPYVAVLTILSAVRGLEFWQQHKKNISAATLEEDMVTHLLYGIIK